MGQTHYYPKTAILLWGKIGTYFNAIRWRTVFTTMDEAKRVRI